MAIPLSYWASVLPGTVAANTGVNTLYALMLTNSTLFPAGRATAVSSADAVGKILGYDSDEYEQAAIFFNGFTNSARKPGVLYVARFASAAAPAGLYGASMGLTLAQTQALTGSLTISIDGTAQTVTPSLSSATSFSDVATILQTAITGTTVTYSSGTGAYTITSSTAGTSSAVSFASGTLATSLGLTSATGAVQSSAINDTSVSGQMETLRKANGMWSQFWCAFDPQTNLADFSAWVSSTNDGYAACLHDTAVTEATISAGTDFGATVTANSYEGVALVYNDPNTAAFLASFPCCLDWNATNGRYTAAFRYGSSLTPTVTDEDLATALEGAGYNFYAEVAGSGETYDGIYPGCVSGQYLWLDSYFNQIWLRRNFQLNLIALLRGVGQIPYDSDGDALIEAGIQDTITRAGTFGIFRAGVTLDDTQIQTITQKFNSSAVTNLQTNGYFVYVNAAGASSSIRQKRQTPEFDFYYTDGQSVQRLTMNAVEVL